MGSLNRRLALSVRAILLCFAALAALPGFVLYVSAQSAGCIYADRSGRIHTAASMRDVPEGLRSSMRCDSNLAAPSEMKLGPLVRTASLPTGLGRMELRWPRSADVLFGRTPERGLLDAARAVERTLTQGSFPEAMRHPSLSWDVVFLDGDLPSTQIPLYLRENCHPGWMVPPASIYIVAQRVAGACGGRMQGQAVADATLARVLIHEMGHAIEALISQPLPPERLRAEGFAAWFEQYAADYSTLLPRGQVRSQMHAEVRAAGLDDPFSFQGSSTDYARVALVFEYFVSKRGIGGLERLYGRIAQGSTLQSALLAELDVNQAQLMGGVRGML